MRKEAKVSDFRQGDVVELHARGVVRIIGPGVIYVKLHDLPNVMGFPPTLLTNLSKPREMSEEEARKLMEDEL